MKLLKHRYATQFYPTPTLRSRQILAGGSKPKTEFTVVNEDFEDAALRSGSQFLEVPISAFTSIKPLLIFQITQKPLLSMSSCCSNYVLALPTSVGLAPL
jgi:hypothetical protein